MIEITIYDIETREKLDEFKLNFAPRQNEYISVYNYKIGTHYYRIKEVIVSQGDAVNVFVDIEDEFIIR